MLIIKMTHICPHCKDTFTNKYSLQRHINFNNKCLKLRDEKIEKKFACEHCDFSTPYKHSLSRHLEVCKEKEKAQEQAKENLNEIIMKKDMEIEALKKTIEIMERFIPVQPRKISKPKPTDDNNTTPATDNKSEEISESETPLLALQGTEYVYLLHEREFVKTEEQIFKIGRTSTLNADKRISQYPKGSVVYYIEKVDESDKTERELINIFKTKFTQRKDIGTEYFEGNITHMIKEMKLLSINTE